MTTNPEEYPTQQQPPEKGSVRVGIDVQVESSFEVKPLIFGLKNPGGTRFPGGARVPGGEAEFLDGGSVPPFTTHKVRSKWFQERVAFPFRDATTEHLNELCKVRIKRAAREKKNPSQPWRLIGPDNIGGRMTALAVDPNDGKRIYAGAAGGGVWVSVDEGRTWKSVWDNTQPIHSVGAIACHPTNDGTVYCATGEANLSADNYPGNGVYVSNNYGETWKSLCSGGRNGDSLPRRIGTIAVNGSTGEVWVGGITHADSESGGMFVLRQLGRWEKIINPWSGGAGSPRHYWCHTIVLHPADPKVMFASLNARGAYNGIWRSNDAGKKWKQLTVGLPPADRFGRTSLAIAQHPPYTIYALAADRHDSVLGVFRSDDIGQTWRSIGWDHFQFESQMSYGNSIAVHPNDPQFVICGGIDLHRTIDGGQTWRKISEWYARADDPTYVHSDHHAVVITADGRVYNGNDGGVAASPNGGDNWENRSSGLAVTMFYDIDVSREDPEMCGGGTQDNGTVLRQRSQRGTFSRILGGDGGWIVFTPGRGDGDPYLFASYQRMRIYRYSRGGWENITPPDASPQERRSVWMAIIAVGPYDNQQKFTRALYTGSSRLWRSRDDGDSWEAVSSALDGSAITAIDINHNNPRYVYAGTTKGGIFRTTDGGTTWSDNLAGPHVPGRIVTRLESFRNDPDRVILTIGGASIQQPYPHVFLSADAGNRWIDVSANLPNVPHYAVAIGTQDIPDVYVASDAGVYRARGLAKLEITDDDALRGTLSPHRPIVWEDVTADLPNVTVTDIVYGPDHVLTAATYGRSLWQLKMEQPTSMA